MPHPEGNRGRLPLLPPASGDPVSGYLLIFLTVEKLGGNKPFYAIEKIPPCRSRVIFAGRQTLSYYMRHLPASSHIYASDYFPYVSVLYFVPRHRHNNEIAYTAKSPSVSGSMWILTWRFSGVPRLKAAARREVSSGVGKYVKKTRREAAVRTFQ